MSELLFLPLALKDICYSSSVTYKQSLALRPGGKFQSLQIAQVTDKLYDSDAKTPVSGMALFKKGGEEGLRPLRNTAHCWERRWKERSEGSCSVLLHLRVLLPKLGWKKVTPLKNTFVLLVPEVFVPAWDPQAKIPATVRKQNACKENWSSSVYFVSMSLSFFLLTITVCLYHQSNQSPTTGLDPDCAKHGKMNSLVQGQSSRQLACFLKSFGTRKVDFFKL